MIRKHQLQHIDRPTLETMSTKALLGRLRALLRCQESAAVSDMMGDELACLTGIFFKDAPEWQNAYADVKSILAHREHVPKSAERRRKRLDRVRTSRSTEHHRRK